MGVEEKLLSEVQNVGLPGKRSDHPDRWKRVDGSDWGTPLKEDIETDPQRELEPVREPVRRSERKEKVVRRTFDE